MNDLKSYLDQTMLKPQNPTKEYLEFIKKSCEVGFKGICIPSYLLSMPEVKDLQKQSSSLFVTVVGFPLGYTDLNQKISETKSAVALGADEVDYVLNISQLKDNNWDAIKNEMLEIKSAAGKIPVKVIIETAYLDQAEKQKVCELVKETGLAFIKTSTGFANAGAAIEDIKLFKSILEGEAQIKASGGIKTKQDLINFIEAGADRIGTSSGFDLIS